MITTLLTTTDTPIHVSVLRLTAEPGTVISLYVAWDEDRWDYLLYQVVLTEGVLELSADFTFPPETSLIVDSSNGVFYGAQWEN